MLKKEFVKNHKSLALALSMLFGTDCRYLFTM